MYSRALSETQTDLMKKGLRRPLQVAPDAGSRNTDRPDEEGIKTRRCCMPATDMETQTDLMKKGLRPVLAWPTAETK